MRDESRLGASSAAHTVDRGNSRFPGAMTGGQDQPTPNSAGVDETWTNAEYSEIARYVAFVMVLGGLVAQAWAWLPSSSIPLRGSIIVAIAGVAVIVAGLLLYGPGRARGPLAIEVALGCVPVIVALAHSLYPREYLVAAYSTGTAAFFLWTTPVLVTVLGPGAGIRHVTHLFNAMAAKRET